MGIWAYIRVRQGKKERKVKNERKHGKSSRNGNAPSPYTKYSKVAYKYDMDAIDRNLARARALGMNYVDYMHTRKPEKTIDLKKAA